MKVSVLVIGSSGHAKVVIDSIEKAGQYSISGVLSQDLPPGERFCGYAVLGSDDFLHKSEISRGVIAVGNNWQRSVIAQKVLQLSPKFEFIRVIHPAAQIGSDVEIGAGTVIFAGACINSGARVGAHCVINTHSSLDHDSHLGDYSCLSPGAVTGGGVSVGQYSWVGMSASLLHGVSVGSHSVVGAGAVVLEDIPSHVLAYGVPCRVIRSRKENESFL